MNPKDSRFNWYIEQLTALSKNPQAKVLGYSKEEFLELIDFLFGPIIDNNRKTVFPEDPRYITYAIQKLAEIEKLNLYLQAKNVPPEIIQAAEEINDKREIKKAQQKARDKVEAFIKREQQIAVRTNVSNLTQAEEGITQAVEAIVRESAPELARDEPQKAEELVKEIEEELLLNFFEAPQQTLTRETYETIIDQASLRIDQVLEERSIPLIPQQKASLKQNLKSKLPGKTFGEASTLIQTDFKLPRSTRDKLPVQGTAFSPVATLFYPADLARKSTGLPVKAAQMTVASELSDEESIKQQLRAAIRSPEQNTQEIVRLARMLKRMREFKSTNRELIYSVYGITSQDFQKAITFLKKEFGAGHPTVLFLQIQQGRQERFELKFPNTQKRIRSIFSLNQRLNQRPAVIELRGTYTSLPIPEPAGRISQAFNQIGTSTRLYQTITEYPGIKVIHSAPSQRLADFRSFAYRKTLHPFFNRLAGTVFGEAVKTGIRTAFKETAGKALTEGLKKARNWLITKLGIKGLITALGAAGGPAGIAISEMANALIDRLKGPLSRILREIKRPEVAIGLAIGGGLFVFFVTGPIGLIIGGFLIFLGLAGLAGSVGTLLGGLPAGIVAFFTVLLSPFAVPIGLFIISLVIGLMVLTLFIVFLTAGAFIIPTKPLEEVSVYFRVTKTASQYQLSNEELENNPQITYTIGVTAAHPIQITSIQDTRRVNCRNDPPPQIEKPVISIPLPDGPVTNYQWPEEKESYFLNFDPSFADCRVCNTVTVIANIPELNKTGEITSHTACVKIGDAPEDCPEGWPTSHGYVTQGPHGGFSHLKPEPQEAIDIGVPPGTPVYATHEGEVIDPGGWGNDTVIIRGDCYGRFSSIYTHLQARTVKPGDHVSRGTLIGYSGFAGTGAHLHYEFSGLEMAWPYVGTDPELDDKLEGCCLSYDYCEKLCTDPEISQYATW